MIGDLETLGDALIIRGDALVSLYRVLRHAQRAGVPPGVERPEKVKALETATHATLVVLAQRHRDTSAPCTGVDWLSTEQVAKRLGVTVRQAQRLAPQLDAERRGGAWKFPADAVDAAAAERRYADEVR